MKLSMCEKMRTLIEILKMTQDVLAEYIDEKAKRWGFEVIHQPGACLMANPQGCILLAAHLDVKDNKIPHVIEVTNKEGKTIIYSPNSVLGGDDRCGVYIMLKLMEKGVKEYCYCFFYDEEQGKKGSKKASKDFNFERYNCFIGLDRRNKNEVALYDWNNEELINLFKNEGYIPVSGTSTDVEVLSSHTRIACVNVSVGFYNSHSTREFIIFEDVLNTYSVLGKREIISKLASHKFPACTYDICEIKRCLMCGMELIDEYVYSFGDYYCIGCYIIKLLR